MLERTHERARRHYEEHGMTEGRRHRWKCEQQRETLVVAPLQQVVRAMAEADAELGGEEFRVCGGLVMMTACKVRP